MRGCDAQTAAKDWNPNLCQQNYWTCDGPHAVWHAFENADSMKACMMQQGVEFEERTERKERHGHAHHQQRNGSPAKKQEFLNENLHLATAKKDTNTTAHFNVSMYCFVAMLPWGPERSMLELSAVARQGIFGCDEADIFSSETGNVGGIDITVPVPNWNMVVPLLPGTTWRKNTPIFQQVWASVYNGGKWRRHDWTIKLDADTVFMADRFRGTVSWHRDQPVCQDEKGCWLENCGYHHLYGAAEVLSNRAMESFGSQVWSCGWRDLEDQWLLGCMYQLGIKKSEEWNSFCMRGCDAQTAAKDWNPNLCKQNYWTCDGSHAVWHAFENAGSMKACMMQQGVEF
jgi:hypothetical protein